MITHQQPRSHTRGIEKPRMNTMSGQQMLSCGPWTMTMGLLVKSELVSTQATDSDGKDSASGKHNEHGKANVATSTSL